MTIAVRSKGGSGGSSASAAGSGAPGPFHHCGRLAAHLFRHAGRGARSAMSHVSIYGAARVNTSAALAKIMLQ